MARPAPSPGGDLAPRPETDAADERRAASRVLRQVAVAAMLGAAVFLVEAGTAELVLRSDAICREVRADNWAFAARGCQPEVVRWFLQGFSRGVVGAIAPQVSPVLGVATMAALMGLVAVLVSRMRLRHAIPGYVAVEVVIATTAGLIAYFVSYLA